MWFLTDLTVGLDSICLTSITAASTSVDDLNFPKGSDPWRDHRRHGDGRTHCVPQVHPCELQPPELSRTVHVWSPEFKPQAIVNVLNIKYLASVFWIVFHLDVFNAKVLQIEQLKSNDLDHLSWLSSLKNLDLVSLRVSLDLALGCTRCFLSVSWTNPANPLPWVALLQATWWGSSSSQAPDHAARCYQRFALKGYRRLQQSDCEQGWILVSGTQSCWLGILMLY